MGVVDDIFSDIVAVIEEWRSPDDVVKANLVWSATREAIDRASEIFQKAGYKPSRFVTTREAYESVGMRLENLYRKGGPMRKTTVSQIRSARSMLF